MECAACGHQNPSDSAYCEACGRELAAMPVRSGDSTIVPPTPSGPGPSLIRGTPIALGYGETVWREYAVMQMRTRKEGTGTLYVTDARVIFFARARGGGTNRGSVLVQETRLGDINGLSAYVSIRLGLLLPALAVFLGLVGLGLLASRAWVAFVVVLALLAGCIWLIVRNSTRRATVGVRIHSSATQASPIGFGEFGEPQVLTGVFRALARSIAALFGVFTAADLLLGFPDQDAERVVTELGALIMDLQSKGSEAKGHWGTVT